MSNLSLKISKRTVLSAVLILLLALFSLFCGCTITSIDPGPGKEDKPEPEPEKPNTEAAIDVSSVLGKPISEGAVTLTESEIKKLFEETEIKNLCEYSASEKASVTAALDKETGAIVFEAVSEDGQNTDTETISVIPEIPFGSHYLTGGGKADSTNYDFNRLAYVLEGTVAAKPDGIDLIGDYAFFVGVTPITVETGSEIVFSAIYAENRQIRFAIRHTDETHYLVFSDYKDGAKVGGSTFLNYKVHVEETEYDGVPVKVGVVVTGGSMAMIINGETVYRRTLPTLSETQLTISTYRATYALSDIQTTSGEEATDLYKKYTENYVDEDASQTLIKTGQNIDKFEYTGEGIYAPGAASNSRIMAGLYNEGVAVGGYEYGVSGHVKIKGYGKGNSASKVEFQIAKNTKNFIKMQIFRHSTNNSIVVEGADNGKNISQKYVENRTLPKGNEYETDFIMIYDTSGVKVWMRDGVYTKDYKLTYSLDVKWDYTFFCFAMIQYTDVTFSGMRGIYGEALDEVKNSLAGSSSGVALSAELDGDENIKSFDMKNGAYYIGGDTDWSVAVRKDGKKVCGPAYYADAAFSFKNYKAWSQGSFVVYADETHAVRYVFEYVPSGYYQVFTEIKDGTDNWTGYTLVIRPSADTKAVNKMGIICADGEITLTVDGYKYHSYDVSSFGETSLKIGGKGEILKISDMSAELDGTAVKKIKDETKEYVYVSPYESRMATLEKTYKDAEPGGVLIAGSSTMDYWTDWQQDIGNRLGYNVGIGGTIVEDWLYCYDRLIKPFNPSKIILFLGGNNVNGMGHTGAYVAELLKTLLNKMNTDFPTAEIYYIYPMPIPNNFGGGQYTAEYANLISEMKKFVASVDYVKGIDTESSFILNGEPIAEYFRPDRVHLTDEGYDVFAKIIKKEVFGEEV